MAYALENNWNVTRIVLDDSRVRKHVSSLFTLQLLLRLPSATLRTGRSARVTPNNHEIKRRGAWHAPAVQYQSTSAFGIFSFKERIEGRVCCSTPFFRFNAGGTAFLRLWFGCGANIFVID